MKRLFLLLYLLPVLCFAQSPGPGNDNGHGADICPPGWEKHPDRHPSCSNYTVLPVKVLTFEGEDTRGGVYLVWTVASEIRHSHYEVERSEDARQWTVAGKTESHTLTDRRPGESEYYRLVSVDIDGYRNYYNPIKVKRRYTSDFTVYTITGAYLGRYRSLSDIPKGRPLIINSDRRILE